MAGIAIQRCVIMSRSIICPRLMWNFEYNSNMVVAMVIEDLNDIITTRASTQAEFVRETELELV